MAQQTATATSISFTPATNYQANAIGTVKTLIGSATAVGQDGITRTLQVGDKVYANDLIQTSAAGTIIIEFVNGTHMNLGRGSDRYWTLLDSDMFNPAQATGEQTDIAALQALIAAGADPTAVAEAAAAGPAGAGAGDEGGSSFVVVDPTLDRGLVTSGFDTTGISVEFNQPAEELGIVDQGDPIPEEGDPEEGDPEEGDPEDDGPSVPTLTLNAAGAVTHDESAGNQDSGTATPTEDNNDNDVLGTTLITFNGAVTTVEVAALFAGITEANGATPGDDLDVTGTGPLGYAAGTASVVTLTGGDFGDDGPAAVGSVTYAPKVTDGTYSGVRTTGGTDIFLYNGTGANAGLILGRVGTEASATPGDDTAISSGTVAFALALDPATGKIYMVQYLSLQQANTTSLDEPVSLSASALQVEVTYTDADGDPASTTFFNIGSQVKFEDDGPSVPTLTLNAAGAVTHDESAGNQDSGTATPTEDNNDNDVLGTTLITFNGAVTTVEVAALFAGITEANGATPGDDLDVTGTGPLGYAAGTASVVTLTGGDFGDDGPAAVGSVTYAPKVTDGTYSGVRTTGGTDIFLYNGTGANAGLILGRVGTEASATPGDDTAISSGTVAFALALDPATGKIYMVQYLSLQQANTTSLDEPVSLSASALQVEVTYTDADGDPASTTFFNIGSQVKFEDDGPSITSIESLPDLANASDTHDGEIVGLAFGTDGEGSFRMTDYPSFAGITNTLSLDGKTLTATINGDDNAYDSDDVVFYTVVLNPDNIDGPSYTFDLVTPQPTVLISLDFSEAGGPEETVTLTVGPHHNSVTFNGLQFDPDNAFEPIDSIGNGVDDINANNIGFGIGNGNIEDNEGFAVSVTSPVYGMQFTVIGQAGNVDATTIYWEAKDSNGDLVDSGTISLTGLKSIAPSQVVSIQSDVEFTSLQVRFDHPDGNDVVRIQNFSLIDKIPTELTLDFEATATDGDGDSVAATFSVNLDGVPTAVDDTAYVTEGQLGTTPTLAGNVLDNDAAGVDGWEDPALVSVTYGLVGDDDYFTHTFTAAEDEVTITLGTAGTVAIKGDGSYEYTPSDEYVANPLIVNLDYTAQDTDGSRSSAVLRLGIADSSEVFAYDNANQAAVEPGETTTTTLANFSDTTNDADSGAGYNPWVFDISAPGISVTTTTSSIVNVADDKWGRSGTDVVVQSSQLEVRDTSGITGSAKVVTPTFEVAAGSTATVSFDLDVEGSKFNTGDTFDWTLYKWDGDSWEVALSGSHNSSSDTTVTTSSVDSGKYRLYFESTDNTASSVDRQNVRVDNIKLTTTTATTTQVATGNVLTDANTYIASTDLWGAVDDKGTEGATLSIWTWDGTNYAYVDTTMVGFAVAGLYGSLLIKNDGSYTYTPEADLDNVGEQDVFSYKLTQPDGDADTANLVIKIGDSAYVAPTPIDAAPPHGHQRRRCDPGRRWQRYADRWLRQ